MRWRDVMDDPKEDDRGDLVANALVLAGSVLQNIGSRVLRGRNETFAERAAKLRADGVKLAEHAHAYGHSLGAAGRPPAADLLAELAELAERGADVDEHQDHAASDDVVGEHRGAELEDQGAEPVALELEHGPARSSNNGAM